MSERRNAEASRLLRELDELRPQRLSVVVTENGADPEPLDVSGLSLEVRTVAHPRPRARAACHNAALAGTASPYLAIASPCVALGSDPFPRLVEALRDPRVAAVAPLVRLPDGRVDANASILRRGPMALRFPSGFGALDAREVDQRAKGTADAEWLTSDLVVMRRSAFDAVGGFREDRFGYFEDLELCTRLATRGFRMHLCRDVEVRKEGDAMPPLDMGFLRAYARGALDFASLRQK